MDHGPQLGDQFTLSASVEHGSGVTLSQSDPTIPDVQVVGLLVPEDSTFLIAYNLPVDDRGVHVRGVSKQVVELVDEELQFRFGGSRFHIMPFL